MDVMERISTDVKKSFRIVFMNGFLQSRQPTAMIASSNAEDRAVLQLTPPGGRGEGYTLVDAGSLFPGYSLRVPRRCVKPLRAKNAADIRVYVPLFKTSTGLQAQFQTPMLINEANHRALQLDESILEGDLCRY
jgi:flagellar assembly factor FliW